MKPERNKPCHCGSGKKYKKCHLLTERQEAQARHEAWVARMEQQAAEAKEKEKTLASQPPPRMRHGHMLMMAAAALAFTELPTRRR